MRVAVIDFAGGNLASAQRALAHAASRAGIDATVSVTNQVAAVETADRLVLPGQGAFRDCRHGLDAVPGLLDAIERRTDAGVPFLGICVGMQLMARRGLEHGDTPGLGWIEGEIRRMEPAEGASMHLPQIGWNALGFTVNAHPLLDGLRPGDHAYFVHSYALAGADASDVIATVSAGGLARAAMVARGNRAGTQFHVEKSQAVGLRILANFLGWEPGEGSAP